MSPTCIIPWLCYINVGQHAAEDRTCIGTPRLANCRSFDTRHNIHYEKNPVWWKQASDILQTHVLAKGSPLSTAPAAMYVKTILDKQQKDMSHIANHRVLALSKVYIKQILGARGPNSIIVSKINHWGSNRMWQKRGKNDPHPESDPRTSTLEGAFSSTKRIGCAHVESMSVKKRTCRYLPTKPTGTRRHKHIIQCTQRDVIPTQLGGKPCWPSHAALRNFAGQTYHPRKERTDSNHLLGEHCVGRCAGVAVAFGAPIGGMLFMIEEGTSFHSTRMLFRSFLST